MKTLLIALGLALPVAAARLVPCSLGSARACSAAAEAPQEDEPAAEPVHSELEAEMLVIEESLGALRRALRDEATFPDALAALARMEAATLKSKLCEPAMAAGVAEADRPAFVRDYRKMMIAMLEAELACETALLDGDAEAANAAFQTLRAFEDDGHERFTED